MEHQQLEALRALAEVRPNAAPLSRREKLERWADLIEARGVDRFKTFYQLEHAPAEARAAARGDGSPFAIAYADPILRDAGLAGDTYGDAASFFELSEHDAHRLFCSCMHGGSVDARSLASELRRMGDPNQSGFFSRIAAALGN